MKKEDFDDLMFEFECFVTSLVFVVLKFTGVITWAWFWVLFPAWVLLVYKCLTGDFKRKK